MIKPNCNHFWIKGTFGDVTCPECNSVITAEYANILEDKARLGTLTDKHTEQIKELKSKLIAAGIKVED